MVFKEVEKMGRQAKMEKWAGRIAVEVDVEAGYPMASYPGVHYMWFAVCGLRHCPSLLVEIARQASLDLWHLRHP